MKPPRISTLLLAVVASACLDPVPCSRYCWSHQQIVADVDDADMTGAPDGRFDATCQTIFNTND